MLPVQGSGWVAVVGDDGVQRRRSCRIVELGEYGQALLNVSCAPKGPWVRRWFRTRRWGRRSGTSPGIRSCWGQYPARGSSGVAAGDLFVEAGGAHPAATGPARTVVLRA